MLDDDDVEEKGLKRNSDAKARVHFQFIFLIDFFFGEIFFNRDLLKVILWLTKWLWIVKNIILRITHNYK